MCDDIYHYYFFILLLFIDPANCFHILFKDLAYKMLAITENLHCKAQIQTKQVFNTVCLLGLTVLFYNVLFNDRKLTKHHFC